MKKTYLHVGFFGIALALIILIQNYIDNKFLDIILILSIVIISAIFNKMVANTKIKELNRKLLLGKNQLEAIFDSIHDPIAMIDEDHNIFRVNRAYADLCGKSIKAMLEIKCHDTLKIPRLCNNCPVDKTFKTKKSITIKIDNLTKNNKRIYFEYSTFPIISDNKVMFVIEHLHDITNEKKMTNQLVRAGTMASIGTMVSGIAHEINNPLSGISGCSTNMLNMPKVYGLNEKGLERINDILDSTVRAQVIMKNLLDISSKKDAGFVITNLIPIIEKSLQSVHLKGFGNIRKHLDYKIKESFITKCDPNQLQQVFINLITNSANSLIEKELIEQEKSNKDYIPKITFKLELDINNIFIYIIDNGMGIDEGNIHKIFDPFFTTRDPGKGTGLGLTICSKIMMEHSSNISVESIEEKTVFTLQFPRFRNQNE